MSKNMPNQYNVSSTTIQFDNYLESKMLSRVSRKNYVSDVRSFLLWNNSQGYFEEFNINSLILYKNYLEISKLPVSSINRSLSSLRAFGDLLVENQALFTNPARMISNVPQSSGVHGEKLVARFSQTNQLSRQDVEILQDFLQ